MLGSLQRLKLLYFCSMIFGYEGLNQGRGREEILPASRDLFFLCSKPALFLVSKVFIQLAVKITSIQSWSQRTSWAEVPQHQRADVKATSMVRIQHSHPWNHHPMSAAFLPFLLTHPLHSSTILLPKGK